MNLYFSFHQNKGISRVVTFLALFNFQDAVRCSCFLSDSLFIISQFFFFVNPFFEFFSKNFLTSLNCLLVPLRTAYSLYHISFRLSSTFFHFLSKLLFICDIPPLSNSFASLSLRFPSLFRFSQSFPNFFASLSAPSDSFSIISPFYFFVK